MKNHIVVSLSELIQSEKYDIEKINRAFERFECSREKDLRDFLIRNAIAYDQKGIGKTFLFLNLDRLGKDNPEFIVDAYVTLAIKGLDISCLTKAKKKRIFGSYPGVDRLSSISVYLIGQLGRADYCDKQEISGLDLLNECYFAFGEASKYIGGNLIFLECREHMFSAFYELNGFHKFRQELNSDNLFELYKKIDF